jgi:hypothetical protein
MNNEKTTSIFRTVKDKQEFVRLFREKTMSGSISDERAIEIIMRDNPHFFRVPDEDEVKRTFNDVLNSEIRQRARAGVQSNKLADRIFANVIPTDKQKPS